MAATSLFWLTFAPALAGVVFALIADAFGSRVRSSAPIAAAALLGAGGLVGIVAGWRFQTATVFSAFNVGTGYSPLAGVVLVLCAFALIGALGSSGGRGRETAVLVSLSALASGLAVCSADLVITLLALETAAVSGYALVALGRTRFAREAAFKYFMQGALASGFLTMGTVALVAGAAGDSGYTAPLKLAMSLGVGMPVLGAVLLFFVALAFKVSAAPFHSWAPDAYQHAPAPAAGVLAGPVKLATMAVAGSVFLALVRSSDSAYAQGSLAWGVAIPLAALAMLSVIVGSIAALTQKSYRRMLGYAGVAQAGYGLIAISAFRPSAAVIHLTMYAIASVAVFLAASAFETLLPDWDGSIAGLGGLGRRYPALGAAVTIALASLAGLPPLAGFWGKFQAFSAPVASAVSLREQGQGWVTWVYVGLVVAGVIGSVVSLSYYGGVVRELFFGDAPEGETDSAESRWPKATAGTVIVMGVVIAAFGIAPLSFGLADLIYGLIP